MRKLFGRLAAAVVVLVVVSGCATTIRFGSENASSLSGDVPKPGMVVNVISVIGRETAGGPMEQLVVWELVNGQPKVLVASRVRIVDDEACGQYLIQENTETPIKFTKLER